MFAEDERRVNDLPFWQEMMNVDICSAFLRILSETRNLDEHSSCRGSSLEIYIPNRSAQWQKWTKSASIFGEFLRDDLFFSWWCKRALSDKQIRASERSFFPRGNTCPVNWTDTKWSTMGERQGEGEKRLRSNLFLDDTSRGFRLSLIIDFQTLRGERATMRDTHSSSSEEKRNVSSSLVVMQFHKSTRKRKRERDLQATDLTPSFSLSRCQFDNHTR